VDQPESVGAFLDEELDRMARVVARDVEVRLERGGGGGLGHRHSHAHRVEGKTVTVPLRDLCSGRSGKIVLRLGVHGTAGERRTLARATLSYRDAQMRAPHAV